ncbi:phosphoribosylformylglycinamidine cyclo-ligase [Rubritalea squalenifaciens DSM 18772]|uniref:Phosphoribosylformylglycinamidine cyclo-ligase n=1 Tax=Rubritalea squalenifaciens DSM 18772 TaxID=1123071 RepID=A0A1M6IGJ6_9BACT|nr:phosphoribosylformylglycinamidine cyclo-ligase [Rubritalea squalenifaciens]SHJ33496.1 phosphoribosylformylglycinamidine cyclo-ligase [Rubritalea squalenifaciens DSM 18772]
MINPENRKLSAWDLPRGGGLLQQSHTMAGKLTYKESGVDTREAAALVGDIGTHVRRTQQQRQLHGAFGLFAAAYDLSEYKEPVIVTGCDGVGTKLELLLEHDELAIAGKDLVAMSVNDILTTGGDPLLFLDYIGIAKLDKPRITALIAGMCDYLEDCGCILAGGETAEMPGIVPEDVVELSGFCIGCSEKQNLIDPSTMKEGDVLVGYASDGPHANGWSLIRRVLAEHGSDFSAEEVREMLAPTRLYHDVVKDVREAGVTPKAMAHITGGGLPENLERLFRGLGADLEIPFWDNPVMRKVFKYVDAEDKFHTFNMGIGWVCIVSPEDTDKILKAGPGGHVIGKVVSQEGVRVVEREA